MFLILTIALYIVTSHFVMDGIRTAKRLHEPRKRPQQARAFATVRAIVDAAAQVFDDKGFTQTTTDLVAERAGVSIGTLYQYFPSKDALLVALFERHLEEVEVTFRGLMARLDAHPPIEDVAKEAVSAIFLLHGAQPRLHRILFEEAPVPARLLESYGVLAHDLKRAWARYLTDFVSDPELVAMMIMLLLESMSHRLKLYPPEERPAAELETATSNLLVAYVHSG